jgi:hypothetical protein
MSFEDVIVSSAFTIMALVFFIIPAILLIRIIFKELRGVVGKASKEVWFVKDKFSCIEQTPGDYAGEEVYKVHLVKSMDTTFAIEKNRVLTAEVGYKKWLELEEGSPYEVRVVYDKNGKPRQKNYFKVVVNIICLILFALLLLSSAYGVCSMWLSVMYS